MKFQRQYVKLLICAICLVLFYSFYGNVTFYNEHIQFAVGGIGLTIQIALWLYLIWQLTNNSGKLKAVRWLFVSVVAFVFIPATFLWLSDVIALAQRKMKPSDSLVQVVEKRSGPEDTTILITCQPSGSALVRDTFCIFIRMPVIAGLTYKEKILWQGTEFPSEAKIQEAVKKAKSQL